MAGLASALADWLTAGTGGRSGGTTDEGAALGVAERVVGNPRTVALRDGRKLGYADLGDPDGEPLVVFHGFPNSRVFGALFDAVGDDLGVRIIAPERPGFGVSDPSPERTLTDWPRDVADLADALDLGTFPVLGVSAGGPYAAVTAATLDDRVTRTGICSGLAPMESVGLRERAWYYLARFLPPASKLALTLVVRRARGNREAFLDRLADAAAPADRARWTGDIGRVVHASMLEAWRNHGVAPLVRETAILGSPWGFDPGTIAVPTYLWYGKADTLVPPDMGWYLATAITPAEAHFYPDLGHLSTLDEHLETIVRTLTA